MANYSLEHNGLQEMVNFVKSGKIQIPNFQREWVWKEKNVKDLLVSILKEQSIGVLTMFRVPSNYSQFGYLPPVNVRGDVECNEEKFLVLDGQQRITAIYQALGYRANADDERRQDAYHNQICEATYVKKNSGVGKAYFYVDMEKYMSDNFGDDVIVIANGRKFVKREGESLNLASIDAEIDNKLFPLWLIFDLSEGGPRSAWKRRARERLSPDEYNNCDNFIDRLLGRLSSYTVDYMALKPETDLATVCRVFEKVNNTGVKLTLFDLLNAKFAPDGGGYNLRAKWNKIKAAFDESGVKDILDTKRSAKEDDFLRAVALIATYRSEDWTNPSCKKDYILNGLTSVDFEGCYEAVTEGYIKAAKFLSSHCGIHSSGIIPSCAQLTPMAAIFATLTNDEINNEDNLDRISKWYWRALFGDQYASSSDSQAARDFAQVVAWIRGDAEPGSVSGYSFNAERLRRLKKNDALGKGIFTLLIQKGVRDFYSGEQISKVYFRSGDFEIHHIFPKDYCKKHGIEEGRFDTIINMTPIKAATNKDISARTPSEYVGKMDGRRTEEETNQILEKHLIDPVSIRGDGSVDHKKDDFDAFYNNRLEALTDMINDATGKKAVIETLSDDYVEDDDGEDDEDDTE